LSSFKSKLLIFVEDPGAANFIAPVLGPLRKAGWQPVLYADGTAIMYLENMGIHAMSLPVDLNVSKLLMTIKPQLLLVGTSENPDTIGLKMIVVARDLNIPSVGLIDGPANSKYRFRGRGNAPLEYVADWLFVPDNWTRESYVSLGFPLKRVKVCGHPYYNLVKENGEMYKSKNKMELRKKIFPDAAEEKSIVIFLTEKSNGLNTESLRRSSEYTFTGRGGSDLRTEIIMEEFLDTIKSMGQDVFLVVRLHPKEKPSDYEGYLDAFDAISQGENPLPLLFAADLIVGLSSSLLVEATILDLNTLSILPHEGEKDLINTVRAGYTPYVTNRNKLRELLPDLLYKDKKSSSDVKKMYPIDPVKNITNALSSLCR